MKQFGEKCEILNLFLLSVECIPNRRREDCIRGVKLVSIYRCMYHCDCVYVCVRQREIACVHVGNARMKTWSENVLVPCECLYLYITHLQVNGPPCWWCEVDFTASIEQNRSPKMILRRSQVDDHLGGAFLYRGKLFTHTTLFRR